jgi:uncharacterized protein
VVTKDKPVLTDHIFAIPVLDDYLIYGPLHNFAALVDPLALRLVRDNLVSARDSNTKQLVEILPILRSEGRPAPEPRQGPFAPAFLGLIPTRGCNLACEYCGFVAPEDADKIMDLELARDAIAWYLDLVVQAGLQSAEVHFFGGEPFCAEEVVDFAFHFARLKAANAGCTVRFEVATNGTFDEERCRWVADSFDTVILSLDGPPDIQDRHRPRKNGRGSFEAVARSATILSQGAAELSFRVCVTEETVGRMAQIAAWLVQEFRPVSVCFEPVQPSAPSEAAGLYPPDPWSFARGFVQAAWTLEACGVVPVYAAADIHARRVSFCPVGQDVAIVSPGGTIAACYLLRQEWEAKGFDLLLGRIEGGAVSLDGNAVEATRGLNVWSKPLCEHCFCRWHCAGGCHVNHQHPNTASHYDDLCVQTRIISLCNILKAMGRDDLVPALLDGPGALEKAVWQAKDTIVDIRVKHD